MSKVVVPKSVRKVLLSDEEVISKTGNFYKDLYATNKRVLNFEKPTWLVVFILIGVLPYFLALLLATKSYSGSIKYSQISGINLRSSRLQFIVVGLILGLVLIALGLFIVIITLTSPYEESHGVWVLGLFFIILGVLLGGFISLRKATFWQIELKDKPGQHPSRWRIQKYPRGDKLTEATEFAKLVGEKAAI
jgi:ABC-type multidrug transport system permease subunit